MCKYYFTICLPRSSLQCFVTHVPVTVSSWVHFREWRIQLTACRCLRYTRCIWTEIPNIKWNAFLLSLYTRSLLTEHKIRLQYDNQLVIVFKGNNRCFLWELYKAHNCTVCLTEEILHITADDVYTRWFKYDRDWFVCKQAALHSSCATLREWSHNLHPPSCSG